MGAGKDFGRLDLEAAANFAAAAERAGVARIVYLGGLVPDDAESEHIVSRRDTGDVLRRGRGAGHRAARRHHRRPRLRRLRGDARPGLPPAGHGHAALGAGQVAAHRAGQSAHVPGAAAADPEAEGRVFDAGGPETLTYQRDDAHPRRGRRPAPPLIIPVPVLSPKLSAYWLRFITAVPTNIARALIEGLKHDFSADDAELRRLVPQHLLGFRESVEAVFAAERESAPVVARWIEGAFAVRKQRIDYAYYAKRAGQRRDLGAAERRSGRSSPGSAAPTAGTT
jgi:hypothetical protein